MLAKRMCLTKKPNISLLVRSSWTEVKVQWAGEHIHRKTDSRSWWTDRIWASSLYARMDSMDWTQGTSAPALFCTAWEIHCKCTKQLFIQQMPYTAEIQKKTIITQSSSASSVITLGAGTSLISFPTKQKRLWSCLLHRLLLSCWSTWICMLLEMLCQSDKGEKAEISHFL